MTKNVITVNPFDCRMWDLHDRLEGDITEETCKDEIESFSKHGQLVPVLGRPLLGDIRHKFELVYGARRLFVARHLNLSLLAEIRQMTDQDAIIAMDIENRQRMDVSPYERGRSYSRWLQAGYFASQDEVARALKISASQVSRLVKLAQLPCVIVEAFGKSSSICEGWGLDLIEALQDPERRKRTTQAARDICNSGASLPAREVYRRLLTASARGRKLKRAAHDEIVKDSDGSMLFRVKHQSNSVALVLPINKLSEDSLRKVKEAMIHILQTPSECRDHAVDPFPAKKNVPDLSAHRGSLAPAGP